MNRLLKWLSTLVFSKRKDWEGHPDVTLFTLNEEINPEDYLIRIRITAINLNDHTVEAVVIKAEGYFGTCQDGFRVGMELKFEPRWPHLWVPCEKDKFPSMGSLPWFELIAIPNGKKFFVHYR